MWAATGSRSVASAAGRTVIMEHGLGAWLRRQIADTAREKENLTQAMEAWYQTPTRRHFPDYPRLDAATNRLSRLDSAFKKLWDRRP